MASLIVMRSVFYRMLLLRRRHLSIEQAKERAAAAKLSGEAAAENNPVAGIATENVQANISAHSQQSRNLVSAAVTSVAVVGLWTIWISVLPALSMVGDFPLWGKPNVVASTPATAPAMSMETPTAGASIAATDTAASIDDELVGSVTVADVALAILIATVTLVLFRNGPGLLEMSILQQFNVDASVRYAITTLVSYVIIMVGTIAACSTIGLQWSQIQWLATALTFGLAFGLQEMFATLSRV